MSIPIYPGIVEEIQSLPSARLFGQAILLRDPNGRTAMLSIAEGPFTQLCGLHDLLELLVMMIEHTLGEKDKMTQWQYSWQELMLEDASARIPTHETQHVTNTLYPLNVQNTMLPFMKTKTLHQIEDINGLRVDVEIQAKIDKGFYQVDPGQHWTCYRYKIFSSACSYNLKFFRDTNVKNLRLRRRDDPAPGIGKEDEWQLQC
jgi:hypothetical protein